MKTRAHRVAVAVAIIVASMMVVIPLRVEAETAAMPSIDLPDPYAAGVRFGELPDGRKWGGVIAVTPDRDGKSIWAFERCGGSCLTSDLPPALEFDPSGHLIKSFGAGMFVFPHGIASQTEDNEGCTPDPGCRRGIRIGSAKDGTVKYYIPRPNPKDDTSGGEGVATDAAGNVFGAENVGKGLRKYFKQ